MPPRSRSKPMQGRRGVPRKPCGSVCARPVRTESLTIFLSLTSPSSSRHRMPPPPCVRPLPRPTNKPECPSARSPVGGHSPTVLERPPVFLLQHAARTIFVALEMRVRDPSIRRCRAWPPYYESQPASSFRTADRKYIMWTASHWFVPAACARTRTVPAFSFAMYGRCLRGIRRIPLGRVTLRSWTPITVNTTCTCISSVRHRSRTVCSP